MGQFDTHGGYFSPKGYLKVTEGGSHEENPNGGVQVGVDPHGVPNLLEEGEPVYNDYVFSDNITADAEILEKHNLPKKYAGKLYSEICDKYVDGATDMPLDAIENNGLNAMLLRLADAQEEQKAIQQQKELEEELANMSPEELAELEQLLAEQETANPEIQDPLQEPVAAVPVEQPMQLPLMANGGNLFRLGNPIDRRTHYRSVQWPYENAYNQFDAPVYDGTDEPITPILAQPNIVIRPEDDTVSSDYVFARQTIPTVGNMTLLDALNSRVGTPVNHAGRSQLPTVGQILLSSPNGNTGRRAGQPSGIQAVPVDNAVTPDMVRQLEVDDPGFGVSNNAVSTITDRLTGANAGLTRNLTTPRIDRLGALRTIANNQGDIPEVSEQDDSLPTWPRYAGAITSGLLGLYNVFQEPDRYTAPHYTPVLPSARMHLVDPEYNPLDENMAVNDTLANAARTNRALLNSGVSPSTQATLLAADYNTGRNIGNARVNVWNANNAARNNVIAAHNQNASALGNFQYGQSRDRAQILNNAALRNLQNDLMLQRLNYAAEGNKYAAIQNQIDAVADALSRMGYENASYNMTRQPQLLYGLQRGSLLPYYRKCGGFIKKYKK